MALVTINRGPKAVGHRPVVRTQKSAEEYFAEQMGWDKPEKTVLINRNKYASGKLKGINHPQKPQHSV